MLKYTLLITPWCNGSTSGFGPLSSGSNPDGVTIFFTEKCRQGGLWMKISGYSVFISALFFSIFSMSDLSAQRIGAVTVQETQLAVDAVLNDTTPQFNFVTSCSSDCTEDAYCRKHNRFRSRKRFYNGSDSEKNSGDKRTSSRNSCSRVRTVRGSSRRTTTSCNSKRTYSCGQ